MTIAPTPGGRAEVSLRRFRPSRPIEVRTDRHGELRGFHWRFRWRIVAGVEARWRRESGHEDRGAHRAYLRVRTHDGLLCVVFRDELTGAWYLESVAD